MNKEKNLSCFRSYDVWKLYDEFNEDIAYRIGRATAQYLGAKAIVLGFDVRETSHKFSKAVSKGICHGGATVLEIGFSGTEQMYSAVSFFNACAGIEITASHNPIDYNGMKIVKNRSQPLTEKFSDIKSLAEFNKFSPVKNEELTVDKRDEARHAYLNQILSFVDLKNLKPLKIIINSGNGAQGQSSCLGQKLESISKNKLCLSSSQP